MKEIGGYFELELRKGAPYHNGLALNTGRNAFEYILRSRKYKKVFLPYYICDALLESLRRSNISFSFYHINSDLEPTEMLSASNDEVFLYVNYFGLKNDYIIFLAQKFKNLIIDNSQAFFSFPVESVDTFYSARKFFGVPDGSYAYTTFKLSEKLAEDVSVDRTSHLIKRIELGAEQGFSDFLNNEEQLSNQPIRLMSKISKLILNNVDYRDAKKCREDNFRYLHERLAGINRLKICSKDICGPMTYPLLYEQDGLREKLIANKIFVATYWNNVFDQCQKNDWECYLAKYLIPLPIDHRYNKEQMDYILEKII